MGYNKKLQGGFGETKFLTLKFIDGASLFSSQTKLGKSVSLLYGGVYEFIKARSHSFNQREQ